MERREMLGLVGAGAAGFWTAGAVGTVAAQEEKKKHDDHHGKEGEKHHHEGGKHEEHHGKEGEGHGHEGWEHGADHEHMKTVGECALICNLTMLHCVEKLKEGGGTNREAHAKAVIYTNDCHGFCGHHLMLMARHSPLSRYMTQACADACRDCAKVCDEGDDEMMKKCAQVCRECEKACREHLEKCEKKG